MALNHYAIDKSEHYFRGLQTETLVASSISEVSNQLNDWMKLPINGDIAVFDTDYLIAPDGRIGIVIQYSKFTKTVKKKKSKFTKTPHPTVMHLSK